jgi:transposase
MLEALIAGQTDPKELAAMAHGRLQATPAELEAALRGRVTAHHRFMLRLHLDQIDSFDEAIARIDKEVKDNDKNFRAAVELLKSVPGVGSLAAEVIVSEIGIEMTRFATASNLVSWAGLCPKNDESAGKRRSNRLKAGAPWLKTTLVQCAWAAARSKGTYLHAQYVRIRARRGNQKAICAVAASILTTVYHMLKDGTFYEDPGPDYFDKRNKDQQANKLVNRLQNLGFNVTIQPAAA